MGENPTLKSWLAVDVTAMVCSRYGNYLLGCRSSGWTPCHYLDNRHINTSRKQGRNRVQPPEETGVRNCVPTNRDGMW